MPTVTSNGAQIRYIREGAGEPVLLLHGYLFGADWWRPQIDALKHTFDVIAIDFRGQMGSETTDEQAHYDVWNLVEDVRGVLDALQVDSVHVVGLSMGGFVGIRLALRYPEHVRSLVLMDTSAAPEDPTKVEQYDAMAEVVQQGQLEAVLPALPPIFLADDFIAEQPDAVDDWLNRVAAANHLGVVYALRGINSRDDVTHRLHEIQQPTLVIHGINDVAVPMDRAETLAERIPNAELATTDGAHQSNVDRPEHTSALIRDFLLKVEPSAGAMVEDKAGSPAS